MRFERLVGFTLAMGVGFLGAAEREARACGGCVSPPPPPNPPPNEVESVVTDHRMILSISSAQTTLYDQVRYSGSPSSFAWVLPISGQVTVGLSSDALFAALDDSTSVTVSAPPPPVCPPAPTRYCPSRYCPGTTCPGASYDGYGGDDAGTASDGGFAGYEGSSADSGPPPVTITTQATVGPYETVQLHSTDPNALENWLTAHGYAIPADVQPIIAAYVAEHYDFLAMKLVPGTGVQAMRPVRVTMAGATTVLPLRMVAAGTGATVGMALWVVGEGRYEPANFPWFSIGASDLVWDYSIEDSNYATVRAQKEAALGGRGWQIETSFLGPIARVEFLVGQRAASGDYDPVTDADGGVVATPGAVRTEDLAALLGGNSYGSATVTRLRSDLTRAALATDLIVQASADQSQIGGSVYVTSTKNAPACPVYPDPPPCPAEPPPCPPAPVCPNADSGGVFGSCAAASPSIGSPEALASLGVLVGLVVFRMRRRRAG